MNPHVTFKPIGRVNRGAIDIHRRWAPGLKGIEGFSHIIVLTWLHKAKPTDMRVRPKAAVKFPVIGFLATRTHRRPNPIGLTVVKLLKRRGPRLWVEGLDAWDGTPVLDIKPYTPRDGVRKHRIPGWVRTLDKYETDPLRKYARYPAA